MLVSHVHTLSGWYHTSCLHNWLEGSKDSFGQSRQLRHLKMYFENISGPVKVKTVICVGL